MGIPIENWLDRVAPGGPLPPPISRLDSTTDTANSVGTSQSGRGTLGPREKEIALRRARDWPIARVHTADTSIPLMVQPLARDLLEIAHGRQPLIPDRYRDSMANGFGPPPAEWFYAPQAAGDGQDSYEEDAFLHREMKKISRASWTCKVRMEYEPAWGNAVHSRLLQAALDDQDGICFRNLTRNPTVKAFQDDDPALRDSKVSYGIMLEPSNSEGTDGLAQQLEDLAREDIDITHFELSDGAPTPLAISILTKPFASNGIEGPAELANWVRAHFRHLAKLLARLGHEENEYPLPALPIVHVWGETWTVAFAYRRGEKTVIWGEIDVGCTDTVYGCYKGLCCCSATGGVGAGGVQGVVGWRCSGAEGEGPEEADAWFHFMFFSE